MRSDLIIGSLYYVIRAARSVVCYLCGDMERGVLWPGSRKPCSSAPRQRRASPMQRDATSRCWCLRGCCVAEQRRGGGISFSLRFGGSPWLPPCSGLRAVEMVSAAPTQPSPSSPLLRWPLVADSVRCGLVCRGEVQSACCIALRSPGRSAVKVTQDDLAPHNTPRAGDFRMQRTVLILNKCMPCLTPRANAGCTAGSSP